MWGGESPSFHVYIHAPSPARPRGPSPLCLEFGDPPASIMKSRILAMAQAAPVCPGPRRDAATLSHPSPALTTAACSWRAPGPLPQNDAGTPPLLNPPIYRHPRPSAASMGLTAAQPHLSRARRWGETKPPPSPGPEQRPQISPINHRDRGASGCRPYMATLVRTARGPSLTPPPPVGLRRPYRWCPTGQSMGATEVTARLAQWVTR